MSKREWVGRRHTGRRPAWCLVLFCVPVLTPLTHSGNAGKRAALLMELIRRVGGVSSAGSDAVITRKRVRAPAESAPCIIE